MSITGWIDGRIAAAVAALDVQGIVNAAADRIVSDLTGEITVSAAHISDGIAGISEHVSLDVIAVADEIAKNITINTGDIASAVVAAIKQLLPPFLRGRTKGK